MSCRRHTMELHLPEGHRRALEAHCRRTGESASHVLRAALSDYLDLEHHTLWQVSPPPPWWKGCPRAACG